MNMSDNPMDSDSLLIERVKQGSRDAAEVLLRRYSSGLFEFLLTMLRDVPDAEDAAQETMIKALRAMPQYEERGQFKAWLYCIAQREGLQVIRKRQTIMRKNVEAFEPCQFENIASSERGPLENLIGREQARSIQRIMSRLPAMERKVFLLRAQTGLSFAEIASLMQCPINTALGRMRNASLKLRRWIRTADF